LCIGGKKYDKNRYVDYDNDYLDPKYDDKKYDVDGDFYGSGTGKYILHLI